MPVTTCDAVVVGAGPNGLVAANALADAGWASCSSRPRTRWVVPCAAPRAWRPGFVTDLFSAFYPLAAASPVIRDLHLEQHGLVWRHAPDVVAHAFPDGRCGVLRRSPTDTAAGLDAHHAGDGEAWLRMVAGWDRVRDPLLDALFTPFPPMRSGLRLLRRSGVAGTLDLTRLGLLSVRRLGQEEFGSEEARVLLTGNAMHSDVSPGQRGQRPVRLAARDARTGRRLPGARGWRRGARDRPAPTGGVARRAGAVRRAGERGRGVGRSGRRACGSPTAHAVQRPARGARRRCGHRALRRPGGAATPAGPVARRRAPLRLGRLDAQGQLGARRPHPVDGSPTPGGRARCTSASTTTGWLTSPPTSRWAGCRVTRSCCSAR